MQGALEQQVFHLHTKYQVGEYYDSFMRFEKNHTFEEILKGVAHHLGGEEFTYFHQVLTDMMREYLIRFNCDVSKLPFRKLHRAPHDYSKCSLMREFLSSDPFAVSFYKLERKNYKRFFKFASNIRKFCLHNYENGKLKSDWIGCLPFLNEIEELLRILRCEFSNNFNFSNFMINNEEKSQSNLEAYLFCNRVNLFIVEFDGCDEEKNVDKLKQLYFTQIMLQYVNNGSTLSLILNGRKVVAHFGHFTQKCMYTNFAGIDHFLTYDLEKETDVMDLSYEIWIHCEHLTRYLRDIQHIYRERKELKTFSEKMKERDEEKLADKVIKNLKRLVLGNKEVTS